MSGSDDFVPLEECVPIGRDLTIEAVRMALKFVREGRLRQVEKILACLNHRLETDAAIEIFFAEHRKLDGKTCYALHN